MSKWYRFALMIALMACANAMGAEPQSTIKFEDMSSRPGIGFRYQTGTRGKHDLPEIMGGGVALIDYDADGLLDIYFCNGGPIEPGGKLTPGELYHNEGNWSFKRVANGPPGPPYAMGAAVGDYNNDGRDDLFITGWRGQRLYRNEGGGTFTDVTNAAGLSSEFWTTSAAFADLDGDGDIDLYVASYVDFDPADAPFIAAPDGKRDYAAPEDFSPQPHLLYRNNGNGTFTNVAREAAVLNPKSRGLGVLVADLVGDDKLDIFVANDGTACSLFKNLGDMKFEDVAIASGVAFDQAGNTLAAMGVTFGDVNQQPTLVVTNFYDRASIAFRLHAKDQFTDVASEIGLIVATKHVNGFGVALADFDDDGRLDLIQANGHVLDRARLGTPFTMKPTLLWNDGKRFIGVGAQACPVFDKPILGRGLAVGDLDNDGRIDAVIAPIDAPPIVLKNTSPGRGLTLNSQGATIRGVGSTLRPTYGGSYLSASDRRPHVSFSGAKKIDRLEIKLPSGNVRVIKDVEPGYR